MYRLHTLLGDEAVNKVDLYCFHHAGGSSVLYRQWQTLLPNNWTLHAVDLPGRGIKAGTVPLDQWPALLEYLNHEVVLNENNKSVFFGHSLGAMIAYYLTCDQIKKQKVLPSALFLSACRAPQKKPYTHYSQLCDTALYHALIEHGLLPNRKLTDDVAKLITDVFRSDFKLAEFPPTATKDALLTMPVHILHANKDTVVPHRSIASWPQFCVKHCFHQFNGDHMYIENQRHTVIDLLHSFENQQINSTPPNNNYNDKWPMPLC